MDNIQRLLGVEHELDEVSRALKADMDRLHAPVVGAFHVTCSDESEHECAESFQRWFVEGMLPALKFACRAPFRASNLGGRYEWGAVRIAEDHFATPETRNAFKLLVVKINGHVAVKDTPEGPQYGKLERYHTESTCCGALNALVGGGRLPAINDLREAFRSEGKDRLAMLRDTEQVDAGQRALLASIASARLQARRATLDIQDHRPATPTLYIVLPCVTFNRPGADTELVCGAYTIDHRTDTRREEYHGLGADPSKYALQYEGNRLHVTDDGARERRPARLHRDLVLEEWRRRHPADPPRDKRLDKIRAEVAQNKHHDHHTAKMILKTLLPLLGEIAPGASAVMLFAKGLAGIHHTYRAHRLARDLADDTDARRILADIERKIEGLSPEQARMVVETLAHEHRA